VLKAKSEFERRLRRIVKEQKLAKVDCYCQNWDGIELRDALLSRFHAVINDARHDFPPLHDLKHVLQRLDLRKKSEMVTHERMAIQQTIAAIQKWLPPDQSLS
jgi:hypothetical protein